MKSKEKVQAMNGGRIRVGEYTRPEMQVLDEEAFDPLNYLSFLDIYCIVINDAERGLRDEWVAQMFDERFQVESQTMKEEYGPFPKSDHAIVIVSGNDTRRMASFIRTNQLIYKSMVKICLMNRSSSVKRAQVIKAGFDDVIDISRMEKPEALCRMAAISRRYAMIRQAVRVRGHVEDNLRQYCDIDRLTPKQLRLFELLVANCNKLVSYQALANGSSNYYEPITIGNVKVMICKIRKHLMPGVTVSNFTNLGYKLTI